MLVESSMSGTEATAKVIPERHLFGFWFDIICLGGGTLVLLPLLLSFDKQSLPTLAAIAMVIADFINHPHFACSYQIFYRNLAGILQDPTSPMLFRLRALTAAFILPAVLLMFFVWCYTNNNAAMLGYAANLMFLLVGWHYVKQGYGILMLSSVLTKSFFSESQKLVLKYNGYACWLCFWMTANQVVAAGDYWGVEYFTFAVPELLYKVTFVISVVTTLLVLNVFWSQYFIKKQILPLAGVLAYFISIYLWLAARIHPAFILFVPALHSLQYLVVVARLEINRSATLDARRVSPVYRLVFFFFSAGILGYLGFWVLPMYFEGNVSYNPDVMGMGMFMFMFWIFINVHHYFIDNVIWRKENRLVHQHLLSHNGH